MAKNLTLSLPPELIKKAKVYAAQNDTTINTLVRTLLEEKVTGDSKARAAGRRILEIAAEGPYHFTAPGPLSKEEMHERR